MPKLTYVIPDLHGRDDLVGSFLSSVNTNKHSIVFLGDYIDRGPFSARLVKRIQKLAEKTNFTFLRGNHEDVLSSWGYLMVNRRRWEKGFGAGATVDSYREDYSTTKYETRMRKDFEFLSNLPLIHKDKYRVYFHGWLNPIRDLRAQRSKEVLWNRFPKDYNTPYKSKYHLVHGHTPVRKPLLLQHRTNLDTNCCRTGLLHVGVFDDNKPGGPVDVLEIE